MKIVTRLLKRLFNAPSEGERKETERGTFLLDLKEYSFRRFDCGYSETIELFDDKSEYLGSFESLADAVFFCKKVYGTGATDTAATPIPAKGLQIPAQEVQ